MTAAMARAVGALHETERRLADGFRLLAERRADEHDLLYLGRYLAAQANAHAAALEAHAERHGSRLDSTGSTPSLDAGETELGLIEDLRILYEAAQRCLIDQVIVRQGALATRDAELLEAVTAWSAETELQSKWLKTRIKAAAPQILVTG
jgi:hypothetical protein